ncbi:hypothetical protein [Leucobacter sp. L43]|uniref:hypothetical protein n=1 Tax=Leucobacter sp. L43 TaxID=2798040 RepID=UPI0019064552|nr:hypothetical protein [Leucobacter sp. L43]
MTKRRPVALGAAITIGFGSLFFASPAFANEVKQPADQQAQEVPAEKTELETKVIESAAAFKAATGETPVAAGENSADGLVILADKAAKTDKVLDYAEAIRNGEVSGVSQILFADEAVAFAETDVVGGAGYLYETNEGGFACSVGFPAWSPEGDPAVISAGHCTADGAAGETMLSKPSTDPANGGTGGDVSTAGALGDFGFYRFGGENSPEGAENDPASTDVSVIDVTNSALTTVPEVTNWTSADSDDLSQSTVSVRGIADPVSGAVAKSGRTTGYTEGNTLVTLEDENGQPATGEILDGYVRIDGRWVHGFLSSTEAAPGDSGGAVMQGENAVGVVSGGPETGEWLWSTRLQDALEYTGGYEVALDIDEPVVKTDVSNGVAGGSDIVVTVPSNAKELSVGQGQSGDVIPVEGTEVSFTAPNEPGNYSYTLVAQNGKSKSDSVELNFEVVLAAPVVDNITSEGTDVTLTGTGVPGAELAITVTPEADGAEPVSLTGTVKEDGTWSVPTELEYGNYTVSATQTFEGETSAAGTGTVSVVPAAPSITSIEPGTTFEAADAPSSISGTGIEGAEVVVKLNGEVVEEPAEGQASALAAVAGDGTWTIDLGAQLSAGTYTVEATQAINGATSSATSLVFNVAAAPVTPVAPVDPGTPGAPADPSNPAAPGGQGGTGGAELVNTGTGFSMLPFGLAALGMLILGGGAIVFTQRRLQATAAE